jgi:hypothetical protein
VLCRVLAAVLSKPGVLCTVYDVYDVCWAVCCMCMCLRCVDVCVMWLPIHTLLEEGGDRGCLLMLKFAS